MASGFAQTKTGKAVFDLPKAHHQMTPGSPSLRIISSISIMIVCVLSVWQQAGGPDWLWKAAGSFLALYFALEWRALPRVCHVMALAVAIATGALIFRGEFTWQIVEKAALRAGFFTLLMTCLSYMAEAARSSPTVKRCGVAALEQKPTLRFAVLALAGHFMGILITTGASALLGTAIHAATVEERDHGNRRLAQIKRSRMVSAVSRGVAAVALWSPTAAMGGVLLTTLPELKWRDFAAQGAMVAGCLFVMAVFFDWMTRPRDLGANASTIAGNPRALIHFLPLFGLIVVIFISGVSLNYLTGLRQITALLICVFVYGVIWIGLQQAGPTLIQKFIRTVRHLAERSPEFLTAQRGEVGLLALASAFGVLLSSLHAPEVIETAVNFLGLSETGTLITSAWIVGIMTHIGISTVISISILAEVLWNLPTMEFEKTILALAMLGPAAACGASALFSVPVRVMSMVVDEPATVVGMKWNLPYAVFAMIYITLAIYMIS